MQSFDSKPIIIIDLLRITWLQFPHYIPLFGKEPLDPPGCWQTLTVGSSRGLDLLRVCPLCRPGNRRSVPVHLHRDWVQRAEMRSVVSER